MYRWLFVSPGWITPGRWPAVLDKGALVLISRTESPRAWFQSVCLTDLLIWFLSYLSTKTFSITSSRSGQSHKKPTQNNPTKFWFSFRFEFCCCLLETSNLITCCRSVKFCHWPTGLVLSKFTAKIVQIYYFVSPYHSQRNLALQQLYLLQKSFLQRQTTGNVLKENIISKMKRSNKMNSNIGVYRSFHRILRAHNSKHCYCIR